MTKRIWIELEKAESFAEAKEICDLANIVMERLCGKKHNYFFAVEKQRHTDTFYNYHASPQSSFTELDDRGVWLNLELLAKDLAKENAA